MRTLVLGAGGIGGYFGGRLVEKGEDVTFLVRDRRKQQLEKEGLVIRSVNGDYSFKPQLVTAKDASEPFDLILLATKAYHLESAIEDLKLFVGKKTAIIPLLNGVAHISPLKEAFGDKVLGGLCFIETTLNNEGHVLQTSPVHRLVYGEIDQTNSERIRQIEDTFSGTKTTFIRSDNIEQEMWHKYLFIGTMAAVTTLCRAPIGPIRESEGGREFIQSIFEEFSQVMRSHGAPLSETIVDAHMKTMDSMTYEMKSSMQRDMEKGLSTEVDHFYGFLLNLAKESNIETPLLRTVYQNLKVYEGMN